MYIIYFDGLKEQSECTRFACFTEQLLQILLKWFGPETTLNTRVNDGPRTLSIPCTMYSHYIIIYYTYHVATIIACAKRT